MVRTPDLIYVDFPVFGSAPVGVPNDCLNVFAFCAGVTALILSKSDLDIGSGATPVISPVTFGVVTFGVVTFGFFTGFFVDVVTEVFVFPFYPFFFSTLRLIRVVWRARFCGCVE